MAFIREKCTYDHFGEGASSAVTCTPKRNHSKSWKRTLLILLVMVSSTECSCPESSKTVEFVEDCPRNRIEWERRAEQKKCDLITQGCSRPSEFRYHCVLNSLADQLIEVCAPFVFVSEYCCEYNQIGALIQRNYDAECMTFRKPCNTSYFSYESYKYPECYEIALNNQKLSTSSSVSLNSSEESPTERINVAWSHSTEESISSTVEVSDWIVLTYAVVILPVATCFLLYCFYKSRVCRGKKFDGRKNTDPEEIDFKEEMIKL